MGMTTLQTSWPTQTWGRVQAQTSLVLMLLVSTDNHPVTKRKAGVRARRDTEVEGPGRGSVKSGGRLQPRDMCTQASGWTE